MLLVLLYPVLILFLFGQSYSSRKNHTEGAKSLGVFHHLLFLFIFLSPWIVAVSTIIEGEYPDISINSSPLTKNADLWFLTLQAVYAATFLALRNHLMSRESWFKVSISALMGLGFLQVSLHPSLGVFFPITTEWAQIISAVSLVLALFLLFHLPPLQLGGVDAADEQQISQQIYMNVGLKLSLAFTLLFTLTFANWLVGLQSLLPLIVAAILIAVALTRVVLRLQTNVFRTLAYLSSGFALSIALKLVFPDFGDMLFLFQFLLLMPLYIFLNEGARDSELRNWASFKTESPRAASRFQIALHAFLYIECAVCLGMMAGLFMQGHWVLSICAAIAAFAPIVVVRDKQAFAANVHVEAHT